MSHSPEPWTVEVDSEHLWVLVKGADDFPVAQCFNFEGLFPKGTVPEFEQAKENASVIKATPELLKACGSALWVMSNRQNRDTDEWEEFAKAAEQDLRSAIAKARGESGDE